MPNFNNLQHVHYWEGLWFWSWDLLEPDNRIFLIYHFIRDFRTRTAFWKLPRPRPFVLLIKAMCRWRLVLSSGGMVLTEGKPNDSDKNLSQCHFVHHKFHIPVMPSFNMIILCKPNIRTRATKDINVAIYIQAINEWRTTYLRSNYSKY